MNAHRMVSRGRAVGLHALASVMLLLVAAYVVHAHWYPYGLLDALGASTAARVTAAAFLVLGPGLMLLLYRPGKRGVRVDVALVLVLQLGVLGAGLGVLWKGRPAFLVFAVDRVTVVGANELIDADLAEAPAPEFAQRPPFGPAIVAAIAPTDEDQRQTLLFAAISGKDLDRFPRFYAPFDAARTEVIAASRDLEKLRAKGVDAAAAVDRWTTRHPGCAQPAYLPLHARESDSALLVSRADGSFCGHVDVDPW